MSKKSRKNSAVYLDILCARKVVHEKPTSFVSCAMCKKIKFSAKSVLPCFGTWPRLPTWREVIHSHTPLKKRDLQRLLIQAPACNPVLDLFSESRPIDPCKLFLEFVRREDLLENSTSRFRLKPTVLNFCFPGAAETTRRRSVSKDSANLSSVYQVAN
jgi:hypothetical protein